MRWHELNGCRVLVWGLGREGKAALELLADTARCRPSAVTAVDDGPREIAASDREEVELDAVDVIVKSPGVSRHRPEIARFLARGGAVTSLTDLALAERHGRMAIGVTGTKGKSTTAALTAHLLAAGGVPVELAGNIGRAPAEVMDMTDRWLVLECSSYQSADVSESPEVGILTSIYEEHLDWHGSFDQYVADKLNLFRTSDVTFVNGEQLGAIEASTRLPSRHLVTDLEVLLPLDGLSAVGLHNQRNANLAVHAAAHTLGDVPVDAFLHALATFEPLPHRLQRVGRFGGLDVVDDGLATAPEATIEALAVFADRHVVLLAGGFDRGLDYSALGRLLAARTDVDVIAMGPAGARIADAVEAAGGTSPRRVPTLLAALGLIDEGTEGVLLLSPAATSYGEYQDYRARGAALRELLNARGMVSTD